MTSSLAFSCPNENISEDKFNEIYGGTHKLLPSSFLSTDRDAATGLLTEGALDAHLKGMMDSGIVPDPRSGSAPEYSRKVKVLLDNAMAEYCFYYNRYSNSLKYLMSGIRNASASSSSQELQTVVKNRLEMTQLLNRKVNDLAQIMNRITAKMMNSHKTLQAEIAAFNASLREKRDKLEEQNKIIRSNEASMRLQKEMVKYTEEKARYSNNLLKLYSFLNIVALGLLVYVYKAAGEE